MKHFIRAFKEIGSGFLGGIFILASIGIPICSMLFIGRIMITLLGEVLGIIVTVGIIFLFACFILGIYYSIQERKENGND